MNPLQFLILSILTAIVCLVAPARAVAEPVSVTASVPANAYVGDAAPLQIIIRGGRAAEAPDIPPSNDYSVAYEGPMQSSQVNIDSRGVMQQSITIAHKYQLVPKRSGTFTIPSVSVTVDGRVYKTDPVQINVVEPSELAGFALEVIPEKTRVYVGEPVRLRMAWRFKAGQLQQLRLSSPAAPAGIELLPHPDQPVQINQGRGNPATYPITLDGETAAVVLTQLNSGGGAADALVMDRLLVARKPGKVTVGPARLDFEVAIGQRSRRPFDSLFEDPNIYERHCSIAKPFEIEVIDLPAEGRPSDFSGLVGHYTLQASVDHREVSVGEPMNLSVVVSGPPPISLVPSMDFSAQGSLARAFRVPRDPVLPTVAGSSSATFQQMIRARSDKVTEVPPIELGYFDTTTGKYAVARSNPIPIKVRPSTQVAIGEDEDTAAADAAPRVHPSAAIMNGPFTFDGSRFSLASAARRPEALALLAAPPAVLGGIALSLALARRRHRMHAALRRRRAVHEARRELRRIRPHSAAPQQVAAGVGHALTNLAADWFGRPRQTLTAPEACRLLAGASLPAATALAPVLADCDKAVFGTEHEGPAGPVGILDRARAALLDAEKSLKEALR